MVKRVPELVFSKMIERNVDMAPDDGFLNGIVLSLACFRVDFMNRVADQPFLTGWKNDHLKTWCPPNGILCSNQG